jgi:23S rRNA (adenine2503-C2)-methyltransferase
MACRFCASGKLGWTRNLSAGEILDQVSNTIRQIKAPIDNIVFMGMGEPLDNFENFLKAVRSLRADWGYGMGGRRITVSTSGLIPAIERFAKEAPNEVKLAISLHGTTEAIRQKIMPINRAYPLKELIRCLERVQKKFKRQFTFEYILIKNLNDSLEDAKRLAVIARRVHAKVNLIPYNTIEGESFERPAADVMKRFQDCLKEADVTATLRYSAGSDINAACGQLRLLRSRG